MLSVLKFQFSADNRTGAGFSSLRNDLKGVKGALAGVQDYARRSGRALRNVGLGMSVGLTGPIAAFGKQSVQLYDQQVKAEKAVAQAILSTGGAAGKTLNELKGLASGLQGITTFGDEDILRNVTAPLLTFTKVQGEAFDRAQANVLDMATLLKMDLKSASILVGKALNDPIKGITALGRSGVQFSEDQKQVIKSLVETGNVAAAQALILKELETEYGGQAAAAAQTPLGKWAQLGTLIGDVKEELGKQITPFLVPVAQSLRESVEWFGQLSPEVKRNVVVFGGLAAAAGPLLAGIGLVTLGVSGLTGAVTVLGGALTFMTGPVGLVIGGLALLAGATASLWPKQEKAAGATDVLTLALGDEIRQSQLLSGVLGTSSTMSVEAARTKLQEAKARHQNVVAIIAENRALALGSTQYSALTSQIEDSQAALNSLGFPARDVAVSTKAERFEQEQARLAGLLKQRQDLLKADAGMVEQLKRTEANIKKLTKSLSNVSGGVVDLGNNMVKPIEPTERLASGVTGLGSSAKQAVRDLAGLNQGLQETEQTLSGQLSPMFGRAFESIVTGTSKAKDALAGLARQVIGMAANKAFTSLFTHIFDSIPWLNGGGFGSKATGSTTKNAKGNAFAGGNVIPFATGGVVNRATHFPMAGGRTGLMGEAGPEAIMPLARGADGKLGVKARGGAGDVNLHVNVINQMPGADVRTEQQPDGRVDVFIYEAMNDALETGRLDRTLGHRFGLRPKAMGM